MSTLQVVYRDEVKPHPWVSSFFITLIIKVGGEECLLCQNHARALDFVMWNGGRGGLLRETLQACTVSVWDTGWTNTESRCLRKGLGGGNYCESCSASLTHFLTLSLLFLKFPFLLQFQKRIQLKPGGEEGWGWRTWGAGEETPLLDSVSARACVAAAEVGRQSRRGFHSTAMGWVQDHNHNDAL